MTTRAADLVLDLLEEIDRTRSWRACRGMRPATDTSMFCCVPPSALHGLERQLWEILKAMEDT